MPQITKSSPKTEIKRFQLDLEFLGFDLGRWSADGDLGPVTIGAAHDAAEKFSLPSPSGYMVPAPLVDGIRSLVETKRNPNKVSVKPPNFVDLTATAYTGPRVHKVAISSWKGLLFHTTGCPMGKKSWPKERIYKRWSDTSYENEEGVIVRASLKAHFGITQNAEILMIHPLEWFVWHAQQGSLECPGVEVESFDYGVPGDPKTLPGGGFDIVPINDKQAQACMDLALWFDEISRRYGGPGMSVVRTHTQFTDSRDPDIGKTGYQKILVPIMERFKISDGGPNFKKGRGRTICKEWNPAYTRSYHDHT